MSNGSNNRVRATISKNNEFYISKHRFYELKHFCLQYKEWTDDANKKLIDTALLALPAWLRDVMKKAVTEGLGYTNISMTIGVPCCREVYYREFRRFFYELSLLKK